MACLLTVRACQGMEQVPSDDWEAFVVIAALSAEPETLDELSEAMQRYLPGHRLLEASSQVARLEQVVSDEGAWCFIDLVGRTVLAGGGFQLPEPDEAYEVDDADETDGFPLVWVDTPGDWVFLEAEVDWRQRVEQRAASAARRRRVDVREILFRRPLLEHLVDCVLAAAESEQNGPQQRYDLTKKIHAAWLMTARDDLGGRTPRQILLADRERISSDLEHRARQWTMQGYAPPSLPNDSFAYRFGGFGTTEIVLYFDLVRSLLEKAWELAEGEPGATKDALIEQLAQHCQRWLSSPLEDGSGPETPAELIESERRRMPVTSNGSHLDCDCPICQVEAAAADSPAFMWFDGHHLELEDEFAFSLTESHDEWQWEHQEMQGFDDEMEQQREGRQQSTEQEEPYASAWQSSFVSETALSPDAPMGTMALAIGFRLAELVSDVKQRSADREHVEALNEAYRGFYAAQSDIALRSTAQLLSQQLEAVAVDFPDLVSKSADLQSRLHEVLRYSQPSR